MKSNEKYMIDELFQKVQQAARQSGYRDMQAEALINDYLQRIPGAAYYMAQAIIVQNQALKRAEAQIRDLQRQQADQSSPDRGFLSPQQPMSGTSSPPQYVQPQPQKKSGGFLEGAAQTALGIGGGVLLANAGMELMRGIGEAFSGGEERTADLLDAYEAGQEDMQGSMDIFAAGYENALDEVEEEFSDFASHFDEAEEDIFWGDDDDW